MDGNFGSHYTGKNGSDACEGTRAGTSSSMVMVPHETGLLPVDGGLLSTLTSCFARVLRSPSYRLYVFRRVRVASDIAPFRGGCYVFVLTCHLGPNDVPCGIRIADIDESLLYEGDALFARCFLSCTPFRRGWKARLLIVPFERFLCEVVVLHGFPFPVVPGC